MKLYTVLVPLSAALISQKIYFGNDISILRRFKILVDYLLLLLSFFAIYFLFQTVMLYVAKEAMQLLRAAVLKRILAKKGRATATRIITVNQD